MKEANLLTQALQMVETDISNTEKACLDTFMFVYVFCIFSLKKSQLFLAQGTFVCRLSGYDPKRIRFASETTGTSV